MDKYTRVVVVDDQNISRGFLELFVRAAAGYRLIAERLCISVNTVKSHIRSIMKKTGYDNRLELAMNAKSLGLVVSDKERTGQKY